MPKTKTKEQKAIALSLTFSIVAIALSLYASLSVLNGTGGSANGGDFDAKVEQSIQAFIEKQQNPEPTRIAETIPSDIEDDDAIKGNENALISVVEFSDYECPFCTRFFESTLQELITEYIDPGKIKFVYRDFPLSFHANAKPSAIAANCAREQGGDEGYFAFHDAIFQNFNNQNKAAYQQHASNAGYNLEEFTACLESGKFDKEVDDDFLAGQKAGISGTPGSLVLMPKDESKMEALKAMELSQQGQFIIQYVETEDGKRMGLRISGAHPFSTFQKAIELGL